jgi:hypothetical protein
MLLKKSKHILLLVTFVLLSEVAVAANFKLNSQSRIKTQISKSGLNRITMLPHRITQVTGDESKYKLKFDEDGSNIYIMPTGKIGETIELSIKSSTNLVQDMLLEVADIAGRSIYLQQDNSTDKTGKLINSEIKSMLRSMRSGEKGKYYMQISNRTIANKLGLDIRQMQTYRWGNIVGAVIEIENKSKLPVNISEQDIAALYQKVRAVSIDGIYPSIGAKSKIRAYVITLDKEEDGAR